MPVVTKQGPPKKAAKGGGAWDRVVPVEPDSDGLKVLVYGKTKVGKTRFACTFPKPMLLIGTEKGTGSVKNVPGIDFIRLESTEDMAQLIEGVKTGHGSRWKQVKGVWTKQAGYTGEPYRTVGQDTAGGFQDLLVKEYLGLSQVPEQRTYGMMTQQGWGQVGVQFKDRMRPLLDLSELVGVHVVVIAHERTFGGGEEGAASDLITPSVGAALTPGCAGWLNGATDFIFQGFIREQTTTKTSKVGGKDLRQTVKTGKVEHCLRLEAHPVYAAGARLPYGVTLPDVLADPSYDKLMRLIKGEKL